MGKLVFNRAATTNMMQGRLIFAVEGVAGDVMALARSLAPVRKTNRYERGTNRSRPITVGYFKQGTDERVAAAVVQQKIKSASGGSGLHKLSMSQALAAIDALDLELRPAPRKKVVSNRAQTDIKTGRGVTFTTGGVAKYGGTLRKSIKVVSYPETPKRARATVRASAPYAKYVEFPTVHNKAQPFLLPAFKKLATPKRLAEKLR